MHTRFKELVKIDNNAFVESQDPVSLPTMIFAIQSDPPNVGKAVLKEDLEGGWKL